MKSLDVQLFAHLSQQAQEQSDHRASLPLPVSADAAPRRVLHALEPQAYVRPHWHECAETILALQGTFLLAVYTDDGFIDRVEAMGAETARRGFEIPAGQVHALVCIEPRSMLFSAKEYPEGTPDAAVGYPEWSEQVDNLDLKAFREYITLAFSKERVLAELLHHGLMERYFEHRHTSTRTSVDAAQAHGVELGQIAKSIVLVSSDGRPLVLLTSGDRRVDLRRVKEETGRKYRIASAEETLASTGYIVGSVSPFAIISDHPVYVDVSLKRFKSIYPAAGSVNNGFRTSFGEITSLMGYERRDWCRPLAEQS